MTESQFWEIYSRGENLICVHCKTYEEAKEFCNILHQKGYAWITGRPYKDAIEWRDNAYTCYSDSCQIGSLEFYKKRNYTIVEYEDLFGKSLQVELI